MNFKIENYIHPLTIYCNNTFKCFECSDLVSDFIVHVLEKGDSFIENVRDTEEDRLKWVKRCFRNFFIDQMRYEERRKKLHNPLHIGSTQTVTTDSQKGYMKEVEEKVKDFEKWQNTAGIIHPDSKEEVYREYLMFNASDETYLTYLQLDEEDKTIFNMYFLSAMDFREVGDKIKKNRYETKLSINRLRVKMKLFGERDF